MTSSTKPAIPRDRIRQPALIASAWIWLTATLCAVAWVAVIVMGRGV